MTTDTIQSARQRAFLRPDSEHLFSAPLTRTDAPREAISQAWAVSLAQHIEPRRMEPGQVGALMLIGWFVSIALGLALLSGCKQRSEPAPALEPDRFDRVYIEFFVTQVMPLAKRDGLEHKSGGCDASGTDLLCVECFDGAEDWIRCQYDSCHFVQTVDEFAESGADVGVCARYQARSGLAVSFTRRAH